MRIHWVMAITFLSASSFLTPDAHADGSRSPRFEQFCRTWMGKLRERETANLRKAPVQRRGAQLAVEYTGYGSDPVRCTAEPTGNPMSPYVGKLVYQERKYRRTSPESQSLRESAPEVIETSEVLEIFRYDGSRWVY